MENIISKIRDLINDNLTSVSEFQEYYGLTKLFNLQYSNIDATTLLVYKNGSLWVNTNYSYSSLTGKITVTGTLVTGDTLEFRYSAYSKYSISELRGYIRSALYHLATEKYKVFTAKSDNVVFPTPDESEEALIAIIATILIKGNIRSYKTPEFTIVFDTDNISVEKKIKITLRQFRKTFGILDYLALDTGLAQTEDN